MLIAEDLLLLLTEDETGKLLLSSTDVDFALAGALLIELTLQERVGLAPAGGADKQGTVVVRDAQPTGDALLDHALEVIGAKPRKAKDVLGKLTKNLRSGLYARLSEKGLVRAEHGKVLGLFPTSRWPEQDAGHERQVRAALDGALVQGVEPESRTASLVALLSSLRAVHKVVDPSQHGVAKKELSRRAKEIAEGNWGSQAVRKAIDEVTAAVVVAVSATAVAGGDGGSS